MRGSPHLLVSAGVLPTTAAQASTAVAPSATKPKPVVRDLDDFSSKPAYARYYRQTLTWSPGTCAGTAVKDAEPIAVECAKVSVPRDWNRPALGSISVMISRPVQAPGAARPARLLLTNPGGPGGPGLAHGPLVGAQAGLTRTHLAVGMDPRGVGGSTPTACALPAPPRASSAGDGDSRTFSWASFRADVRHQKSVNTACLQEQSAMVPYLTSDQVARDMNLVRSVLGYRTTDFFGLSYGSWLGSILEKMFPTKVDRIVLDGNTDWRSGSFQTVFGYQPEAFQASFDRVFAPFVGRHHDVFGLGRNAKEADETYARVRVAATRGQLGSITPDLVDGLLVVGQYSTRNFGLVATAMGALDRATKGDRSGLPYVEALVRSASAVSPSSSTTQLAVTCGDTAWDRDARSWFVRGSLTAKRYPLLGPSALSMGCAGWTARPAITKALVDRPVSGVLMLHTEVDPATAYRGALSTHYRTPGTRLLVVDDGAGHGAFGSYACADAATHAYLAQGRFPTKDLSCQAGPYSTTAGQKKVADTRSYEFLDAARNSLDLPAGWQYVRRDLSEPGPDGVPATRQRWAPTGGSASTAEQVRTKLVTTQLEAASTGLAGALNR